MWRQKVNDERCDIQRISTVVPNTCKSGVKRNPVLHLNRPRTLIPKRKTSQVEIWKTQGSDNQARKLLKFTNSKKLAFFTLQTLAEFYRTCKQKENIKRNSIEPICLALKKPQITLKSKKLKVETHLALKADKPRLFESARKSQKVQRSSHPQLKTQKQLRLKTEHQHFRRKPKDQLSRWSAQSQQSQL